MSKAVKKTPKPAADYDSPPKEGSTSSVVQTNKKVPGGARILSSYKTHRPGREAPGQTHYDNHLELRRRSTKTQFLKKIQRWLEPFEIPEEDKLDHVLPLLKGSVASGWCRRNKLSFGNYDDFLETFEESYDGEDLQTELRNQLENQR